MIKIDSYTNKALFLDCYTKEEIKGNDFDSQLPDDFVSRTNVEYVFDCIDSDLNSIEWGLNQISGLSEIAQIKKDVQELRRKLV